MSSTEPEVKVVVPTPSEVKTGFDVLATKEAKNDAVPRSERWGQLIPLAGAALIVAFFAIHQLKPTGFFTAEYGTTAQVLLYGALVAGAIPFVVRLVKGSKNFTRPFEIGSMAVSFVGQLYLLLVFPFNFAYFAAPLPSFLEFLLDWVPADLGKLVLGIGVVGSVVFGVYTFFVYFSVRRRLTRISAIGQGADTPAT